MRPKASILVLLTFALLMVLGSIALAVGGDSPTLFTDNVTATGTTMPVTEMEQQLLNCVNVGAGGTKRVWIKAGMNTATDLY
jgi:hypothetical protein